MLKMMAIQINETNYPLAAALLPGDFLLVPEKQTYGNVVVINQALGRVNGPIDSAGGARRAQIGFASRRTTPYVRRNDEERVIRFENSWYNKETFDAEFDVNATIGSGPGQFWEISHKAKPDYSNIEGVHAKDDVMICDNPDCPCYTNEHEIPEE